MLEVHNYRTFLQNITSHQMLLVVSTRRYLIFHPGGEEDFNKVIRDFSLSRVYKKKTRSMMQARQYEMPSWMLTQSLTSSPFYNEFYLIDTL